MKETRTLIKYYKYQSVIFRSKTLHEAHSSAQLQHVVSAFEQLFSKELSGNVSDELNRALKAHKRALDGKYFTQEVLDALNRRSTEIQEGEK